MSARGKIAFAREAEKLEKEIMGVVNGEKNGFAAVAVGACSRERADGICRELTELLKKYPTAIFGGIGAGVITAMVSIWLMSLAFGLNHAQYVTLLPKSITTAIGMGVSDKMGGMVTITVVAISITGIFGTVSAELICKLFKITEPIAKGLAIGTASHALGTTKALEIGEIEGAMSSLSIVVAGIMTVLSVSFFANLI